MSFVPGLGIVKGMALTLRRFFEPKVTVMYPEVRLDVPHKFRGRLQLLYDEWGTLKCETCFQCAQACPIECIDMGGIDTRDHDPARMLDILEATQTAYGYLPVAALKRISHETGAWYAMIYGTASYYAHLRFEPAASAEQKKAVDAHRPAESTYLAALDAALDRDARPGRPARARP